MPCVHATPRVRIEDIGPIAGECSEAPEVWTGSTKAKRKAEVVVADIVPRSVDWVDVSSVDDAEGKTVESTQSRLLGIDEASWTPTINSVEPQEPGPVAKFQCDQKAK